MVMQPAPVKDSEITYLSRDESILQIQSRPNSTSSYLTIGPQGWLHNCNACNLQFSALDILEGASATHREIILLWLPRDYDSASVTSPYVGMINRSLILGPSTNPAMTAARFVQPLAYPKGLWIRSHQFQEVHWMQFDLSLVFLAVAFILYNVLFSSIMLYPYKTVQIQLFL